MAAIEKKCKLAHKVTAVNFLYNTGIFLSTLLLPLIAVFNPKIKKFISGRKDVFSNLQSGLKSHSKVIWVHSASLGEFEQGLPVIQLIRKEYPDHAILITFFSPSGYEVRKNTDVADLVTYLPLDSRRNAKKFLEIVQPRLAIFIKYEIWPNYLKQLNQKGVPAILISAIFNKRQVYFKWYGGFMRKALKLLRFIYVQNQISKELLSNIGLNDVEVSGDTRFDRVSQIRTQPNQLNFMESFKGSSMCFVAGSTWPEDEEILLEYINKQETALKFVIAPHDIKDDHIRQLRQKIKVSSMLYSEINEEEDLSEISVLVIDTIGLLTKIYSYADMAYVGGGFATGLHNTLEPAVFGIPVIIGPEYHKFQEALDLVHQKGILVIKSLSDFERWMRQLLNDEEFRRNTGLININYINNKRGASVQIMKHIRTLL